MARLVLLSAAVLLVLGPVAVLLGGGLGAGVLLFSLGVVLLGVHSLLEGRDRTVGWVLIFVGATAALGDLARILLAGG